MNFGTTTYIHTFDLLSIAEVSVDLERRFFCGF